MKTIFLIYCSILALTIPVVAKPAKAIVPILQTQVITAPTTLDKEASFSMVNSAIDELLVKSIADVDALGTQLISAQTKLTDTELTLTNTLTELTSATSHADELQKKIVDETNTLNNTREQLNKQIDINGKLQKELDITKSKLAFWHKIVAGILAIVTIYGAFLVLKVMGKV